MINDIKEAVRESDETIYERYLKYADGEDLKELLSRHREGLSFFIYGFVNNMEDAEELMLDAFAVAASGRAGFAAKSSFKTWLFGIGRNLAHKHLRKKRFTFLPINEEIAENAAYEPDKGIPELELLKNERSMMLYEALRSIHEDYRQALELIYFEEMSSEEVAKVLKKTKKQVYNLVARGKQAMKEALEKAGFKE